MIQFNRAENEPSAKFSQSRRMPLTRPFSWLSGCRVSSCLLIMGFNAHLVYCLNNVLNVKALVGIISYQEKALVGAFSMNVKPSRRFV